jgi:hypothetical protein
MEQGQDLRVFIIDDEPRVIAGVTLMLRANGFAAEGFTCAAEFLGERAPTMSGACSPTRRAGVRDYAARAERAWSPAILPLVGQPYLARRPRAHPGARRQEVWKPSTRSKSSSICRSLANCVGSTRCAGRPQRGRLGPAHACCLLSTLSRGDENVEISFSSRICKGCGLWVPRGRRHRVNSGRRAWSYRCFP